VIFMELMKHKCPDGVEYEWVPRVPHPRQCPRCKNVLDYSDKERLVVVDG